MEKISIIIPVYNTEQYITRCLTSVLNQTHTNLEIICIDDGSSDNSGLLLDNIAKTDSRVIVIHNQNMGVSEARNTGLKIATGEYIGFVDSDDYIDPEMYEKMYNAIICQNVDVVTCSYNFAYEDGSIVRAKNMREVPDYRVAADDFQKYIYERDVYKGVAGYLWTRLIKRECIYDNEGELKIKFDKEYNTVDDIVFVAELNLINQYILYIDEPLYYYYYRNESITHSDKALLESLDWVRAYEKIIYIYNEKKIDSDVIDMIKRMYVFRCGKTLEAAIKYNDIKRQKELEEKIKANLMTYLKTNMDNLERVSWIIQLLLEIKK